MNLKIGHIVNKNLIYIVALDGQTTKIKNSDYSVYSINTWRFWCEKNGVDLFVLNNENLEQVKKSYNISSQKFPIWFKESIYKFGKGYNKIGIVDSDTMIRWDAPNIFDFIEDKFYGVNDLCDLNWLLSSIEQRQKFFPDVKLDINKYLNAGVLFFPSKYLDFFEKFLTFVLTHEDEINSIDGGGKEQTLLNFFLQKEQVEVELLDPSWNLLSIHKKNMFQYNWQLNQNKTPYFINYAYIWHMTGFPIEDRVQVMKSTWEFIQNQYK